ncbi:hypothetical protein [Celeribacter arenosi]|uniref:SRPBCC family protein n=1 Tax=Celeribacter arenosi TaxID=792649 RepID=A0ABP7KFR8_9RHOB
MKSLYGAALAAAIFATPISAKQLEVSSVMVEADLTAVDANALAFWPEIAGDLTRMVAEGLSPQFDEGSDYSVEVELFELSLEGNPILDEDGEFNTIRGWIYLYGPDDDVLPIKKYKVDYTATADGPDVVPTDVIVVPPSRGDYYDALTTAFAAKVITDISGLQEEWLEEES